MINRIGRQAAAYTCYGIALVCALGLWLIWTPGGTNLTNSSQVLTLIFIMRFAITTECTYFYVYFNELYPTQVRVLGTGFISVIGALSIAFAPLLLHFLLTNGFQQSIMLLFAFMSAISIASSYFLPETLGKSV